MGNIKKREFERKELEDREKGRRMKREKLGAMKSISSESQVDAESVNNLGTIFDWLKRTAAEYIEQTQYRREMDIECSRESRTRNAGHRGPAHTQTRKDIFFTRMNEHVK